MTIKEIASLAGVSISTVSKIVNNKDENINPHTRERVLKIVKEYNYTPYGTVKNISTTKTFLLGVLLCNAPQTNRLLSGIMQTAQEKGYSILLLDSSDSTELELRHITTLCRSRVDGLIWEPVCAESRKQEHYFQEMNIPVCYINDRMDSSSYAIDFVHMGYLLTQKLIDYKHTHIACLMKRDSPRSQMVFQGFRQCLFDNQIPYDNKMEVYVNEPDFCRKILSNGMSGIVSSHFASSLMLYEQMILLHYYIPSDLSLVSLRDDVREAISFPNITSLKIPYYEFGCFVCKNLIARCEQSPDVSEDFRFSAPPDFDDQKSIDIPSCFRSRKIVVVGSVNLDCTFRVDQPPQLGKTVSILDVSTAPGGEGANQALGAAKLGREVSLIGEIGNDTDSDLIINILEQNHVDTHGVHRDPSSSIGKAYIYTEKSGESAITVFSGANCKLSPASLHSREYLFKKAGYCLLSTEIPTDTILEAARISQKYGVHTILKPVAIRELPEELFTNTNIFVPNRMEAQVLCPEGKTVEEQADYFFRRGIPAVIITLGQDGCYLRTADCKKYFPASNFVAVDSTGGADSFIAALASCLTEGYSLEKSIRIATYAAGFCVSRQGVMAAMADRSTLYSHIYRIEPSLLIPDSE